MEPREAEEAAAKRRRLEGMFVAPMGGAQRTPEEAKEAFDQATKSHPFMDVAEHLVEVSGDAVFFDGRGNVVGVLMRQAVPEHARKAAADVLRAAATRTSLRASIFGGEAPMSGIAGYYDYSGSPVEYKCRKTSFTCEVIKAWPNVFPLVDYVSGLYKATCPREWEAQNGAIPDVVRIHNTPFSTLTINQRFRTAKHTDAGDFDAGYGLLSILDGDFEGLHLGLTDFKVCFHMKPRDVLLFNTHHFHANTELERFGSNPEWSRLTCVFYYRAVLGERACMQNYRRRLEVAKSLPASQHLTKLPDAIEDKDNGDNHNRPAVVFPVVLTPVGVAASLMKQEPANARLAARLHMLLSETVHPEKPVASESSASGGKKRPLSSDGSTVDEGDDGSEEDSTDDVVVDAVLSDAAKLLSLVLLGEPSVLPIPDGLPQRSAEEKIPVNLQVTIAKGSALGGFSEARGAIDVASKNHTLLDDDTLRDALGAEAPLLVMWREARSLWLSLVKRDWDYAVKLNPTRDDFSWKNKSDMNAAFFDLCEVGKQVMVQLLGKEQPTRVEENAFWLCFAGHLYTACEQELHMAKDAMSMKKLNVKLKDFNFGGTRYFKDMPKEEQERRLARKKRIEEARRLGANQPEPEEDLKWLENDDFDYQSEDAVVPYRTKRWVTPADNAASIRAAASVVSNILSAASLPTKPPGATTHKSGGPSSSKASTAAAAVPTVQIRVLVVVPAPQDPSPLPLHPFDEAALSPMQRQEWDRLMTHEAAKRSLAGTLSVTVPPSPKACNSDENAVPREEGAGAAEVPLFSWAPSDDVAVTVITTKQLLHSATVQREQQAEAFDFVFLRHCLSFEADDAVVMALVRAAVSRARNRAFVTECVVSCRSTFTLTPERLAAHDAVAKPAFQRLLSPWVAALPFSAGGQPTAVMEALRGKSEIQTLLDGATGHPTNGMFHFHGSARNATCWVL